ncbi:MAG: hypothetical protein KGZ82_03665, partial [Bacteroidales bacterium]|nr:hypothetical protein [Bacteroidales bacterium]
MSQPSISLPGLSSRPMSIVNASIPFHKNEPITLLLLGGGIRYPALVGALRAVEEKGLRIGKI